MMTIEPRLEYIRRYYIESTLHPKNQLAHHPRTPQYEPTTKGRCYEKR